MLPSYDAREYAFLLHFIMLYHWRTKASVDNNEDVINQVFKERTKNDPKFYEFHKNNYKIKHAESAAFNLATFMNNWVVAADLELFLIENRTEKEFLLSDNPLVTFNPFMINRDCHWAANSILSKGLTMIFPLTPHYSLFFKDPIFYDVKTNSKNIIHIDDENDIYLLNLLQAISADQNLYFANEKQVDYVEFLGKQSVKDKQNKRVTKIIPNEESPGKVAEMSYVRHEIKQYFSFLRESEAAKIYKIENKLRHPRNNEMVDWIKKST